MKGTSATGTAGAARVIPQAPAQHFQTTTRKRTYQDVWIVQNCPHGCGGVHRHNGPGLRVSACGRLYRVVQAA